MAPWRTGCAVRGEGNSGREARGIPPRGGGHANERAIDAASSRPLAASVVSSATAAAAAATAATWAGVGACGTAGEGGRGGGPSLP